MKWKIDWFGDPYWKRRWDNKVHREIRWTKIPLTLRNLVNHLIDGSTARKESVKVPWTKLNGRVLEILRSLFIINGFTYVHDEKVIPFDAKADVLLKYSGGRAVVSTLRVVGGCASCKALREEKKYRNVIIVSTNRGLMTRAEAIALGVGGVVLLELC